MVAYQPGNAANMPAPATISQTSLPSHQRPDRVLYRRPGGRLSPVADHAVQHADAEVEPPRMKNPGPQDRDDDVPERDKAAPS